MSQFKRLRRRAAVREAQERAAKRIRQGIIMDCRNAFGIRGQIAQSTKHYLYHIARLIENEDRDLVLLIDQWRRFDNQAARTPARDKPKRFFYYLRDHKLSTNDQLVFVAYQMIAEEDYDIEVEAPRFHGLGDGLLSRLSTWLGDQGGNDMEEVLIDYLLAVFKECAKFRKTLIANPSSTLGDFGWRTWNESVVKKYGSRNGYLLPTEEELKERQHQDSLFAKLADLQAKALQSGNIILYDSLGAAAAEGDAALRLALEEQHVPGPTA